MYFNLSVYWIVLNLWLFIMSQRHILWSYTKSLFRKWLQQTGTDWDKILHRDVGACGNFLESFGAFRQMGAKWRRQKCILRTFSVSKTTHHFTHFPAADSVKFWHRTWINMVRIFYRARYASPVLAVIECLSVCLSVRPSVRLSQVGVIQRWLNLGSH